MNFNPVPKDAPPFSTDQAHYVGVIHKGKWRKDVAYMNEITRWYEFRVGRSEKAYFLQDKYLDDKALSILERSKKSNIRLMLKGYNSPSSVPPTMFVILTHIAHYKRSRAGGTLTNEPANPLNGQPGYYELSIN